ncbi:CD82 antigen [Protopterus annectens]|uniref:CD82 antigen n=1 Tax=Protopterus annectens TaxID=7888 RepID=UPI001CFAAED1|nr:CD82 antigen [Protopterus annectens]
MASGCLKVTKYFLFLFNFLFFILGAVILGFGLWIVLDKASFISVVQDSYTSLKIGSYVLMGVGSATMVMGFLGCLGAVNEVKCLLGLYFACLLVLLLAQIAAGVFIYLQRDGLKDELNSTIHKIIVSYNPYDEEDKSTEDTWDYIQISLKCCGSKGPNDWATNIIIANTSSKVYPCSCADPPEVAEQETGFCSTGNGTAPVYGEACMVGVQTWLLDNIGIILGVCIGVAAVELLGMILSMCLCKNIRSEEYTKVPKY